MRVLFELSRRKKKTEVFINRFIIILMMKYCTYNDIYTVLTFQASFYRSDTFQITLQILKKIWEVIMCNKFKCTHAKD